MTACALVVAVVTVAFPKEGQRFPALSRCYAIGATDGGETNLVVNGRDVAVSETGAWGVLLDVVPGTNAVEVADVRRTFVVAAPPAATNRVPAKAKSRSRIRPDGPRPP